MTNKMARFLPTFVFGVALLIASDNSPAEETVSNIFLVQNSGWMLPFYEDQDSKFKELVAELSSRVSTYGNQIQTVASFNQSIGQNQSPLLVYQGSNREELLKAVRNITLARKPGRQSYADTDFKEAIVGAITKFSPGEPCLLWIITNNKNSPNNSPETIAENKEFYRFLQETSEIKRIVAFPYSMPVQGKSRKDYRANGLMIYAMAYGAPADSLLQQMLASNAPFGKQPARLKPLDAEALTFIPKGVRDTRAEARLGADHKTIVLTFDAESKPELVTVVGQLRSDFYPYDIESAQLKIGVDGFEAIGVERISAKVSANAVHKIPAGGISQDIDVAIKIPAIPSLWDPDVIFGKGYTSSGSILFTLDEQKLAISKGFLEEMTEIFPGDPLPDLFTPGDSAKRSVTSQAFVIRVNYPGWPLLIIGGVGLALIGAGIGGFAVLRRERTFQISVDGFPRSYSLRPFGEVVIKDQQGARVGTLKRKLGRAEAKLDKGQTKSVRLV